VYKIGFDELVQSMSFFLDFPEVEDEIEYLVAKSAAEATLAEVTAHAKKKPVDVLSEYLCNDPKANKLKLVVRIAGGSIERLKRIVEAMYNGASINDISKNEVIRKRIASFLINPNNETMFIPRFIRGGFKLPYDWMEYLKDERFLFDLYRDSVGPKYAARMGFQFEQEIREKISELDYVCEKGKVEIVGNKEVDIVVPQIKDPVLLVMVSYSLTTSSLQSSKANEQRQMYNMVQERNRSRLHQGKKVFFVNVVDGGGWISRSNDLRQFWLNCDFCFTYQTLDDFRRLLIEIFNHQ